MAVGGKVEFFRGMVDGFGRRLIDGSNLFLNCVMCEEDEEEVEVPYSKMNNGQMSGQGWR